MTAPHFRAKDERTRELINLTVIRRGLQKRDTRTAEFLLLGERIPPGMMNEVVELHFYLPLDTTPPGLSLSLCPGMSGGHKFKLTNSAFR